MLTPVKMSAEHPKCFDLYFRIPARSVFIILLRSDVGNSLQSFRFLDTNISTKLRNPIVNAQEANIDQMINTSGSHLPPPM